MADTLLQAASFNEPIGAGTTTYWYPVGSTGNNTTEADSQIIFHSSGTLRNLLVRVIDANTANGSTTVTLRKDSVNGNLSVTIAQGLTGTFEDETDLDTVEDGSKLCYRVVVGGASGVFEPYLFRTIFTREEETVTRLATTSTDLVSEGKVSFSAASTTYYSVLCGFRGANTNESQVEGRQRKPGTYRNFAVYVSENGRSTTSTSRLRINNANTSITTSIGAGLTGLFEDTTHTATVAIGDDANYSMTLGTGTGDLHVESYAIDFVSGDFDGIYMAGNDDQNPGSEDVTDYYPLMGTSTGSETESHVRVKSGFVYADYKELTILVSANNLDTASTLTFRKNGANGNLSISIPANTTGVFTDTSEVIDAALPNDEVNLRLARGTGGAPDELVISYTLVWGFIVPLRRQKSYSMSQSVPEFQQYNLEAQSHFFGFDSPMFGD